MFLTQENYKQIQEWLKSNAIKDTEFNDASLPFDGTEYLAFVQNGENVKVLVTDFTQELAALGVFDVVIEQGTGDSTTKTMSQAAITEELQKLVDSIGALADSLEYEDSYATGEFVGAVSIKDSEVVVEKKALSLKYDSGTDDLSISDGTSDFTTVSLSSLRDAIDANTDLIIDAHASVSLAASKTVIERGVSTSVTFTGTASFNGSTDLITEMDIYANSSTSGTAVKTSSTSPVTYTASLSSSVTYSLKVVFGGVTKTTTRSVNAYYPIYVLASASTPTASTITSGTKQSISSTAAGSRSVTTSDGDYVWLCVPSGVTVPSSATMSGFDCPITNEGTVSGVSVNGASVTYTLVRTTNTMKADTLTIVYS